MKQGKRFGAIWINIRLIGSILPIMLVMLCSFCYLVRSEILSLSRDRISLESSSYAREISTWSKQVLGELEVYRVIAEHVGLDSQKALDILSASYGAQEAYPYGLYFGDNRGTFFNASGWDPGPDYAVTERTWYQEGLGHAAFAFGEPYVDAYTGKVCVSASVRVNGASAATVLAADVYLDYAASLAEDSASGEIQHAFFVTRESRTLLAGDETELEGLSLREDGVPALYKSVNALLDRGVTGLSEDVDGYFVHVSAIESTNWYFVTCASRQEVLRDIWRIQLLLIVIAVLASVLLAVITRHVAKDLSDAQTKARLDPLTKLLNRGAFKDAVTEALKKRRDRGLLLMMDLDNFKLVNDRLGHPAGDAALREFAALTADYFNRSQDIVGRLGGDEFAVFVGGVTADTKVSDMLEKFIASVRQTLGTRYADLKLTTSIGGALVTEDSTYESLYQRADAALYDVKRTSKDAYTLA